MNALTLNSWIEANSTHGTDANSNASLAPSTNQTIFSHGCHLAGAREIKAKLEQPWNLYQHVKRVYAQEPD